MSKTQITAEPGMPQIIITCQFDAPRDLVFRAHTDPELLVQWLGPRDLALTVERYDTRDGGRWRYVHTDSDGNSYEFHGVFHGDPSPDAIVQTFEFEGAPATSSSTPPPCSSAAPAPWSAPSQLPLCGRPRRNDRLRHGTRHP